MKRLSLFLALALACGIASVQAAGTHHAKAKLKAISAEGEVVSVDTAAKTATVKVNGEQMTHPVKGSRAVAELGKLKAGDKVRLTVMADASTGEHEYISAIRPATRTASTSTRKKSY